MFKCNLLNTPIIFWSKCWRYY